MPEQKTKKMSLWQKALRDYIIPIVAGILAAKGLTMWVVSGAEVVSGSMVPTLPYPTYLLVDHLAVEAHAPYRGEVIIFHHPANSTPAAEDPLLKRIIGLPGDTVEFHSGHVYINGNMQNEPYIKEPMNPEVVGPFHVPPNEYFVMGDNRNNSFDSRYWQNAYVPRANILGRVDMILWPPQDWKIVH